LVGFTLPPTLVRELQQSSAPGQVENDLSTKEKEAIRAQALAARLEDEFNTLASASTDADERGAGGVQSAGVSLSALLQHDRFQAEWKHDHTSLQYVQQLVDENGQISWHKLAQCDRWLTWQEASQQEAKAAAITQLQSMPREVLLLRKELILTQPSPLDEPDTSAETSGNDSSNKADDSSATDNGIDSDSATDMSASSMLLHLRKLRALFEAADVDGSGSISRKELLQAVRNHAGTVPITAVV
jgi:hypothetical protein